MSMLNKYIDWYIKLYIEETYFTKRKAKYMAHLMHYLIFAVLFIISFEMILVDFTPYVAYSGFIAIVFFTFILMLLRNRHLTLSINFMIFAGIIRLFMIYFYPTPYQFYVMSLVNILILAVIHTEKYQFNAMAYSVFLMMVFRIPITWNLIEKSGLHWRALTQSIYACVFLAIFILMCNFLVRIINEEISKTVLLQKSAYTDHLTGLKNRRYFWEIIDGSDMLKSSYSIILFDIDHFKQINDTFGHDIGDEVLKHLSAIADKTLGDKGQIFRWGGEEFLIFLPRMRKENVDKLCEAIRKNVQTDIQAEGIRITVSIGVSENGDQLSINQVIANADQAMYAAKCSGRNQICYMTI